VVVKLEPYLVSYINGSSEYCSDGQRFLDHLRLRQIVHGTTAALLHENSLSRNRAVLIYLEITACLATILVARLAKLGIGMFPLELCLLPSTVVANHFITEAGNGQVQHAIGLLQV
jgi:hypothetical protein